MFTITRNKSAGTAKTASDMSENQKIIPASMYSPELFSLVLEQSPLAILVTDASGIALWENDSYRRLFNEGNGSPSACKYDLFKDELINEQGFAGELKKTFLSGQVSTFILEKPQCTDTAKDTQQILQTTILPLKDPAGNVVNAVVRYQDITINQQRERELIEKLKNYEAIYNTTSSGVIIYETGDGGKSFIIKDMNRASESIEHLQREDVIGRAPVKYSRELMNPAFIPL